MNEKKVLIVEDEGLLAMNMKRVLVNGGFSVTGIAVSGEKALKSVKENRPDLVLMDIKLKGKLDGIETVELINEQHSIPVIYLSAHADENTMNRASRTNPIGFIRKPVEEGQLCRIVRNVLKNYKPENIAQET